MYAIIKCGGKQYKIEKGEVLVVDHVEGNPGDKFDIEDVLMMRDDKVTVGDLGKIKVVASIVEQFKGDKIIVFKYKSKKNYRRKRGHRSHLTKIRIEDIKVSKPRAAKKAEAQTPQEEEVTA
ncbi:MAG TPA: 50S ribosomal protein L21 [Candidatus Aquicultor sp.]|jgi:large subunit ribosomal protein L21